MGTADGTTETRAGGERWWRSCWPDLVVVGLILVETRFSGMPFLPDSPLPAAAAGWLYAGVVLVYCLGLLLRRVRPLAAVCVLGVALLVVLVSFDSFSASTVLAALVAVETTQSRLEPPWRGVMFGVGCLGALAASAKLVVLTDVGDPGRSVVVITWVWLLVAVAALVGAGRRRRRERVEQALERVEILRAQQEIERRLAVARERQRIARDVHDLLGHSLSVIGMQAEGARAVLAVDPGAAGEALEVIGRTSRRAVDEVRVLVDVLREGDGDDGVDERGDDARPLVAAPDREPVPVGPGSGRDVAAVVALVCEARRAGLPVSLSLDLDAEVPADVAETVYRAVQESLTNVVRHAAGAPTVVELRAGPDRVEAVVENGPADPSGTSDGDGAASVFPGADGRSGAGLAVMRERVGVLGGTVRAGAAPGGGWRVHVRLPGVREEAA